MNAWTVITGQFPKKRCVEVYNKVAGTEYSHKDDDDATKAVVFEVRSVLKAKTRKEALAFINTTPENPPVEYEATPYEIWQEDWRVPASPTACVNKLRKAWIDASKS